MSTSSPSGIRRNGASAPLTGKVALLTGAGSGLGRAVLERYLVDGAQVCVLERSEDKAAALRADFGDVIHVVEGDVRSVEDNVSAVDGTLARFGRLDALVGFQGVWDGNVHLMDLTPDQIDRAFDEMFSINVKGYVLSARIAAPALLANQGTIILTASNASFHTAGGGVLYVASKHAVLGVVRELAYELAPKVRVNGVAPASIGGSDLRGLESLGTDKDSYGRSADERSRDSGGAPSIFPLTFRPQASDYAGIYSMLASDDSRTMTGSVIEAEQGMRVRGFKSAAGGGHL